MNEQAAQKNQPRIAVPEGREAVRWTATFMNGDPMPPDLVHWSELLRRHVRETRPRPWFDR
jgi:hypothetical protein